VSVLCSCLLIISVHDGVLQFALLWTQGLFMLPAEVLGSCSLMRFYTHGVSFIIPPNAVIWGGRGL